MLANRIWPAMLIAASVVGSASVASAEEIWQVMGGGSTTITLLRALSRDVGAPITAVHETAKPQNDMEAPSGFAVATTSDYKFRVRQTYHREIIGGSIRQLGGFTISVNGKDYKIEGFDVSAKGIIGSDGYYVKSAAFGDMPLFELSHCQIGFDSRTGALMIGYADMTMTSEFAKFVGKPSLTGQLFGSITIQATATKISGTDRPAGPGGGGGTDISTDVRLEDLSGFSYQGHTGTYPTGRAGFAMSTTSCNVSATQGIDWFSANSGSAPMDTRHPYILQNLYRLSNGRFEQIGMAWAKHGFFATNATSCAGGSCAGGGGSTLKPKCTDTYGVGNNNDRNWLGPREEINPTLGTWNNMNSFFANYSGNVWNSSHGSGWDAIQHRLEVNDADMTNASGTDQFFYEGYYVCKDDVDLYNNIGSRRCTLSWTGSSWNVSTADAEIFGAAVQTRWPGSTNAIANPRTDGDNIVAVKVTDNGNGTWHYEYAVYNHSCDRAINEFAVPIQIGASVTNFGFHDLDTNAANDWLVSLTNGEVRFVGPSYSTDPNGNALRYGRLFNFRFDSNAPPVTSLATIGLFKPGTQLFTIAATTGPQYGYFAPWGYTIITGTPGAGNLASLVNSDNDYLQVIGDPLHPSEQVEFNARSNSMTATEVRFKVETSSSRLDMAQQIALFDYAGNAWTNLSTTAVTATDNTTEVVVSTNPVRFIDQTSLGMKARVTHIPASDVAASDGWLMSVDLANWKVTP